MRLYLVLVALATAAAASFPELAKQAAAARDRKQADQAIRLYRECLGLNPSWAEGWWYLGTLLYDGNRFADGRDALARFLQNEPKSAPGWAMLGLCEFETAQYEQALSHLQRGLSLGLAGNPQIRQVSRYHVAILLTHFSQFEASLQIFVQMAAEGVEDPNTKAAAGIAALRMPLLPAEVPAAQRELAAQVGRAVFDTGARHAAEAKREFDELVVEYPDTPEIHYLYGGFLLLSDADRAIGEWKREIEISPRHVAARLQLAFEYLKRGDTSVALPYAEEAVRLEPNSFVARNALGRVLVEAGELKRGIPELEAACKLSPESPENHVALASAYTKAGRTNDAARERAEFLRLKKQQEP